MVIPFSSYKMAGFEEPSVSYEETKDRAKVDLHDLSEGSPIEGKYMGTDSDRHDMIVLGRKQVLRVCKIMAMRIDLMVPSTAKLPIPIYCGLCRGPDFYLGDSLRVCGLPYGGSPIDFY